MFEVEENKAKGKSKKAKGKKEHKEDDIRH
jgi:hypothetical protein